MITEHSKAHIDDIAGSNHLDLEINWDNPRNKDHVRITMGDKKAIVTIKDLYEFIFWVANEEQQANLIPTSQTRVKIIEKVHKVKVTKDIKAGQFLNVKCVTNVPVEVVDGLSSMMGKKSFVVGGLPIIGK